MTQALFTAMTGLNAGTEQLTVVSDNVANMNTTAYKTSRVDFQDVWYKTSTTGTNSTVNSGGTNPYQIGVGVKCSAITKDFSASSINTTGRTEDMAIQGDGWFTVINSDGAVMLTRDGNFTLDEKGYICTANGCKVLGMDVNVSNIRSDIPLRVPTQIKVTQYPTKTVANGGNFDKTKITDLNGCQLTGGTFKVHIDPADGSDIKTLEIDLGDVTKKTVEGIIADINAAPDVATYFKAEIIDGAISFKPTAASKSLEFESGTSNFVSATNLASMPFNNDLGAYVTKEINTSAEIGQVDDVTSDSTKIYDSFSIGKDGLMTVTYSDGSTLTVSSAEDGSKFFTYQNANGVIINADTQNSKNGALQVDPNILVKANMQCQMAKVANNAGLVAVGGNMYNIGVNCGDVLYSAANVNGVGEVATGALESSNVDLAQQFSNMILAQRLVQANSQVFSSANSMLETLVYLGQ
ncbi:MAG: flagellar hook-basal body complex protein [Candidatus Gastranaerophilales bacterium]|nr:flagellar hook-basal body complex protein [Candidatus Gastranaerophilales bacterium]